ncbi:hypothetical protein FSP39_006681 [Pinctada imbricata]|uniref:G-protein coupled receptors family 1 profile domain-containing protein n=1 Tax=Pinctada imbricata TaxID=66713 RepID=A0AA88Y7X6_PINIB|nr:hypothetical protein FSP39_006681 [Pinctada imbricata]
MILISGEFTNEDISIDSSDEVLISVVLLGFQAAFLKPIAIWRVRMPEKMNGTLFDSRNDTAPLTGDRYAEAIVLLTVGFISSSGNFVSLIAVILYSRLRCTSMAILCHHCFLDLSKSLYCFPFGLDLLGYRKTDYCNLIGSTYVFLMTTSAYNFLALVVHEEYELTSSYYAGEGWCVLFGIAIIWFMSLLLNLGVSIIPSNTKYIEEIGNCMFPYGKKESYAVHIVWISLVTCAVALSFKNFLQMYRRISCVKQTFRWGTIHDFLASNAESLAEIIDDEKGNGKDKFLRGKTMSHYLFHLRRVLVYICMITSFALFWYPLFLLTIVDFFFQEPKLLYRLLTIFAWSQPIMTPVFIVTILRDVKFKEHIIRDLSSNLLPMKTEIKSRKSENREIGGSAFHFGIENEHFDQDEAITVETSFIGSSVRTEYVPKVDSSSVRSTPTRQHSSSAGSTPTHSKSPRVKIVSVV